MIVRGAWSPLLRPGLRRDFRDEYNAYPEEYSAFLKVGTQEKAEIEAASIGGLPRMVEVGEGQATPHIDPVMGDLYRYRDKIFKLGFIISEETMEDDLYHKADQHAKWLGRSARMTQEYEAAALLDDAFTGTYFTGDVSERLCYATHALLGSSLTGSNVLATGVQLSVTGLQAMYDLGAATKDQRGYPMPVSMDTIVVNITDEWVAIQLTKNPDEPFTMDRNLNALRTKNASLGYSVNHYKTQDDHWFGVSKGLSDAHFAFRVKPRFTDGNDDNTGAAYFRCRQRVNVYFHDWRGFMGSNP